MKDPAVLFYTGDFLTGCTGLTMEERGQYITMLCLQHLSGHLNKKTISLSVGSVSVDVLSKFKIDEDGCYYNERLQIEIEKRSKFIDSRISNGKNGGRPKKQDKTNEKPSAKPNEKTKEKLPVNRNRNIDLKEVEDYFFEKGYSKDAAKKFFDYYSVADWCDSKGNKVKNWKQKAQSVWFKPENEVTANNKQTLRMPL